MRTFNRSVATLRAFTRSTVVALLFAALPAHAIIKSQPAASGAGGSVTSVSVATANGFKGTVATATTTPAISIGTTVTGILVGNGSSVAAAAWSDVQALLSGTCNSSTLVHGDGSCSAGSSGTVTSVALTMPSVFTVTGSPITGAGTFGVTYATGQTADQVLATPDQTTGAVALRSLTSGYIPATLNSAAVTVVATTNQANTGTPTIDGFATTANVSLVLDTAQTTTAQNGPWIVQTGAWTRPAWYPTGGTSQVTGYSSVIVRQGTTYQGSTWKQTTAAPITIDTSTTTWVVTPFALNASTVTGTLGVTNGGNGLATATLGDLRYGSGTNTLAALPGNTTATKQFLTQTGTGSSVSAIPAWATIVGGDLPLSTALTWTAPQTISLTGQTANTKIITFDTENATPATSGNQQQNCHAIGGQGFGTTAGTSQAVQLQICDIPVQGLVPTLNWVIGVRIAGGAFVNLLEGTYAGNASFTLNFDGTGNFSLAGSVMAPWIRVNGLSSVTPTGSGLYACQAATSPTCVGLDIASASVGTYTTTAFTFLGDLVSDTLGRGLQVKEGTNGKQGTCTLAAGTCTVTTTSVTANSRIFLTAQSLGTVAVPSGYGVSARTAGTSFTILASAPTDTSVIAYEIFEPAP